MESVREVTEVHRSGGRRHNPAGLSMTLLPLVCRLVKRVFVKGESRIKVG